MNYISSEITFAAAITSVFLCIYTYSKDRCEKEPISLLLLLFFSGGLLSIPVIYGEKLAGDMLAGLFKEHFAIMPDGSTEFSSTSSEAAYYIIISFATVALFENAAKWLCMFLLTHKNKNFNSLFDGLIYGVFVSLGFAMIDNIRFAWINGWDFLLLRSLTTIPVHMFIGVFMGYYYSLWHTVSIAAKTEKSLASDRKITVTRPFRPSFSLLLSFFVPLLIHGLYTFSEYSYMYFSKLSLYLILTVLFALAFNRLRKTSQDDAPDNKVAAGLILKKYPDYKAQKGEEA